jgi:hypothetical protein
MGHHGSRSCGPGGTSPQRARVNETEFCSLACHGKGLASHDRKRFNRPRQRGFWPVRFVQERK